MIKVVLFDVDGVLVQSERFSVQFSHDYHIPLSQISVFFENDFKDCITGKSDLQTVIKKHLVNWKWQGSVDDFLHYWFTAEHKIDQQLIEYIQQLRQRGIRCYIATNQEKYRTRYLLEEMGFGQSFDGLFSSSSIGHKKPQKEFFKHIFDNLKGINKNEILFWDNSEEHVSAARAFGIQAELYTNFPAFLKTLKLALRHHPL